METRKKIRLFKDFGPLVGFSSACSSAIRRPMAVTRWKDRCILRWLKENYGYVLLKYKEGRYSVGEKISSKPATVWSVWWQGEEHLPETVRMCLTSVNKHRGGHPFKIITEENYREYINLPEYILEKVRTGTLRLTHFSDIIRLYLLSNYGGLWLDATVLVTDILPDTLFSASYYTIRHKTNPYSHSVPLERWTTFFQAAQKGNILCSFVLDVLLEYWKNQTFLIDYVLFDYVIALAYEELPECKRLLDSVPLNNPGVEDLRPLLNSPWDPAAYEKLAVGTRFFKLTWKHKFNKTTSGRETFYGHLIDLYGE